MGSDWLDFFQYLVRVKWKAAGSRIDQVFYEISLGE